MVKKRAVSSQEQRRAGRAAAQHKNGDIDGEDGTDTDTRIRGGANANGIAYTIFRSTMSPKTYSSSVALQSIAVAYCLFLLNGRPSSLLDFSTLLRPLCEDTIRSSTRSVIALLAVQLYFATLAKEWLDHATETDVPNVKKTYEEEEQQGASQERADGETGEESNSTVLYLNLNLNQEKAAETRPSASSKTSKQKLIFSMLPGTLIGLLLLASAIFCLTILLGAPVSRLVTETALLSTYLAILAFTAPLVMYGNPFSRRTTNRTTWTRVFAGFRPRTDVEIAIVLPSYGAIAGAMIGVVPEGLDWERPWQKWPVPCLVGSYTGWLIGQLASVAFCALMASAKGKGRWRL